MKGHKKLQAPKCIPCNAHFIYNKHTGWKCPLCKVSLATTIETKKNVNS